MAISVRLTPEEQKALAHYASCAGMSQNEVMRAALREYVERQSRAQLIADVMDQELPPFAEALKRLGQ